MDKGKLIAIVELVFALLALILSIIALAGGVADDYDVLKSVGWLEQTGDVYYGWRYGCSKAMCMEIGWDKEDAATAMASLSFIFAIVYLVLVAVKLCKPNKMLNIVGCGVGFLGMLFTIACFALYRDETGDLPDGVSYGPGFGACVACFVFQFIALVLGGFSLFPAMATAEVGAPEVVVEK